MKVIYTISNCHTAGGGLPRCVSTLADAMAGINTRVELITLDFGYAVDQLILPNAGHVKISLCKCGGKIRRHLQWSPAFSTALLAAAKDLDSLLVHDNGIWLPINHQAAAIARNRKIPLVISPHGMLTRWSWNYRRLKKRTAWFLYQKRDLQEAWVLHATALEEADDLRLLGLKQPIAVIPNGVHLPPPRFGIKAFTREFRTALFLSRIHPKKGLLDLVSAWDKVRPAGWKALIAGSDELNHRAEVEEEIRRRNLSSQFEFIGEVDDKQKWKIYQAADLFILPTKSENFGIVIAEALAAEVPVITTQGTPWGELLTHRCGWWIEIGPEPLAAALQQAIALSDDERMLMGQRGRQLVKTRYSWQAVVQQMKEVYEWVLGSETRPDCIVV